MANPSADNDNREQGVEFGEFDEHLEAYEYPTTTEDLLEDHGEKEIGLPSGTRTLHEILSPLLESPEDGSEPAARGTTYDSADQVRQSIFNLVDSDAIGRKGYTDRDPPALGEERDGEQESL